MHELTSNNGGSAGAGAAELRLLGEWLSPFCIRVKQALAVKGVAVKDLEHKSELLLSFNPVHAKVPVLIHRGAPVCESLASSCPPNSSDDPIRTSALTLAFSGPPTSMTRSASLLGRILFNDEISDNQYVCFSTKY